jgi:hypothetical protein
MRFRAGSAGGKIDFMSNGRLRRLGMELAGSDLAGEMRQRRTVDRTARDRDRIGRPPAIELGLMVWLNQTKGPLPAP